MKLVLRDDDCYILAFHAGDRFLETLKEFVKKEGIKAATFDGIGAVNSLTLGFFNSESKNYQEKVLNENLEVVSLTGNISKSGGDLVVHAHGVFGNSAYQGLAGHIKDMTISVTLELRLDKLSAGLERSKDDASGLNLLN